MPDESAWNMYIFREGKVERRGSELVEELTRRLHLAHDARGVARRSALLDALIRAGELECALFDRNCNGAEVSVAVTDQLSFALVTEGEFDIGHAVRALRDIVPPEQVSVARPEGFAYYALHPLKFADLALKVESTSEVVAVVGVRSIGTTLSSVVQSALRAAGKKAERRTVRPEGHPYNRETRFVGEQLAWVAAMNSRRAQFFVVDEGPGMSGSSFLSVGDALLSAGAARPKIAFLCSRQPDVHALKATNAASRWPSFSVHYMNGNGHLPISAETYIGGGIWRGDVFASEDVWPASWTIMERAKFLSGDRKTFYKFEGFGAIGEAVHERARQVGLAGFGPMPIGREEGYGVYPMLRGRTLTTSDASPALLKRVADYCAFRAATMKSVVEAPDALEGMVRYNAQQEFGGETTTPGLSIVRPVVTDSRMVPHKWIECDGAVLKVDSSTHGDDHFFPGPTDIAWDLAGTIVEWNLDDDAAHFFLNCYRRTSGDDAFDRVPAYLLAYSVFRMAYWKMASAAMNGTFEEGRLVAAYQRYRKTAERLVQKNTSVAAEVPVPRPSGEAQAA